MRNFVTPCLGNNLIGEREIRSVTLALRAKNLFRYTDSESSASESECHIAQYLSVPFCRLTNNGTSALRAALLSLNPRPGDIVIIPGLTFIATANSVLSAGLIPRFLDVDITGHLCPETLHEYLNSHLKPFAVICVHLDGASAKINEIKEICDQCEIYLIEDAAQSFSATAQGKKVGTIGHFGCYSFQANKILSTGEGGCLVCSDSSMFRRASEYSDHGAYRNLKGYPIWHDNSMFGENFKATELEAAILLQQISRIEYIHSTLKKRYHALNALLPSQTITSRPIGSIPISIWIEDVKLINEIDASGIPYYTWDSWDMINHPIIKNRNSPYRNNFPWNMESTRMQQHCPEAELIASHRISLPVPLDNYLLDKLYQSLIKITG